MTDIKTPFERSRNMAAIHNKDTKPEIYLRKLLFSAGYRYRKNVSNIYGHPDIWLAKYNTAIFVNGCFWHRHDNCKYSYTPKSNTDFWIKKFDNNIKRDIEIQKKLKTKRIKCLVIWECTVKRATKDEEYRNKMLKIIEEYFQNTELFMEI